MKKVFIKNNGFSLMEVLLAVSILATGTVGVLRAYARALDALSRGERIIDVIGLLKGKMADFQEEEIEKGGFAPEITRGDFFGKFDSYHWEIFPELVNQGKVNKVTLVISQEEGLMNNYSLTTYFMLPKDK